MMNNSSDSLVAAWIDALVQSADLLSTAQIAFDQQALELLRSCSIEEIGGKYRTITLAPEWANSMNNGYVYSETYEARAQEALAQGFFTINGVSGPIARMYRNLPTAPSILFAGELTNGQPAVALDTGLFFRGRASRDGSVGYLVLAPRSRQVFLIHPGPQVMMSDENISHYAKRLAPLVSKLLTCAADWLNLTAQPWQPQKKISLLFHEQPRPPYNMGHGPHFGHYVWNLLGPLNRMSNNPIYWCAHKIYKLGRKSHYFSKELELQLMHEAFREKFHLANPAILRSATKKELVIPCHSASLSVDLSERLRDALPPGSYAGRPIVALEMRDGDRSFANSVPCYTQLIAALKVRHADLAVVIDGFCPDTVTRLPDKGILDTSWEKAEAFRSNLVASGLISPTDVINMVGQPLERQLSELKDAALAINAHGGGYNKSFTLAQVPQFVVGPANLLREFRNHESIFQANSELYDEEGADRGWSYTTFYISRDLKKLAPISDISKQHCTDVKFYRDNFTIDPEGFVTEASAAFEQGLAWCRTRAGSLSLSEPK